MLGKYADGNDLNQKLSNFLPLCTPFTATKSAVGPFVLSTFFRLLRD